MRWFFALFVLLHGLLHLLGFVKAFELAELSTLTQPISRPMGVVWFVAAVLLCAAAGVFAFTTRAFWMIGLVAALVSQVVIITSWSDARVGTLANLIIAVVSVMVFVGEGPVSLRSEYRREVRRALATTRPGEVLGEGDLASLPPPLRRYLEVSGAVGRPRVSAFRARWRGRIRSSAGVLAEECPKRNGRFARESGGRSSASRPNRGSATSPWMDLSAEQVNTSDPPSRLFFMDATMRGVPITGLHAYLGDQASMRVRVLGLVPVADGRGPEMTRAETVTLLNDACMLAPSMLTSPAYRWEALSADRVRGVLTNAGHTVSAELIFGEDGMLRDFVSDDRSRSIDGKSFERLRWSTPLSATRAYGPVRLASHGEARWHLPDGTSFAYVELELEDIEHDPRA